ncbi:hypothetical protein H2204_015283 [Knufia peltigerae]|uniref:Carbonic anhydrase n=1 Tax=Knufia peltigerae TaxID=1002370 RepID=A0AA39CK65_9EURO|nr:hypothetical protein H2204_015283 [Knufia peltigerae]
MSKSLGHDRFNPYVPFDFKAANDNYVKNVFKDQDPPVGASSRVGIITCCDARSSPDHFFQLSHNQAFIIRNGGGRTSPPDVIRTLASIEILSDIKEIMVIHHTDCGSLHCSDEFFRNAIAKNDPGMKDGPFLEGADLWIQGVAWVPFDWKEGETERQALDRSVVDDVLFLRRHPLMKPSIPITGWVYNGSTGAVEEIGCGLKGGRDPKQLELLAEQLAERGVPN